MNVLTSNRDRYSLESCIDRCERTSEQLHQRAEDFERAGPPFSPTVAREEAELLKAIAGFLEELRWRRARS